MYPDRPALFAELPELSAEVKRRAWVVSEGVLAHLAAAAQELEAAWRVAQEMEMGADSFDNTETSRRFQDVQAAVLQATAGIAAAYRAQLE